MIEEFERRLGARIAEEYGAMTPVLAPVSVPAATVAAIAAPVAMIGEAALEGGIEESEVAPWPTASEEAAYLSGSPEGGAVVPAAAASASENKAEKLPPLPPLEELIQRVPESVREALDELFRAKFTSVRRV